MTYELGKYYQILHVRARHDHWQQGPRWYPVIGPPHEDREIIGFPELHYHVDARFLPAGLARRMNRWGSDGDEAFSLVIHRVDPIGVVQENLGQMLATVMDSDIAPMRYMQVKRVKMKRDFPAHVLHTHDLVTTKHGPGGWLPELEEAYKDEKLLPGAVCPHRLTDLSTFEPDAEGCVTCPLHGLKWHVESGRLVRVATRRAIAT